MVHVLSYINVCNVNVCNDSPWYCHILMTVNDVILMEYFGNILSIFKSTVFGVIFSMGKIFLTNFIFKRF